MWTDCILKLYSDLQLHNCSEPLSQFIANQPVILYLLKKFKTNSLLWIRGNSSIFHTVNFSWWKFSFTVTWIITYITHLSCFVFREEVVRYIHRQMKQKNKFSKEKSSRTKLCTLNLPSLDDQNAQELSETAYNAMLSGKQMPRKLFDLKYRRRSDSDSSESSEY